MEVEIRHNLLQIHSRPTTIHHILFNHSLQRLMSLWRMEI